MLITSHVAAGALIGAALRRPVPAFAAGFVSHLVMDQLPHWGFGGGASEDRWLHVARRDGVTGLASIAALLLRTPTERRPAILAGIVGACLPDTDKIGRHFVGRSPWPAAFDRFHVWLQREAPHRLPHEIAAAAALTAAALVLLRRLT